MDARELKTVASLVMAIVRMARTDFISLPIIEMCRLE
jgi:hypothetical protein